MPDLPVCEMCKGPGVLLGRLGSITWFRCRNCGWEFTNEQAQEWADFDNLPEYDLEG